MNRLIGLLMSLISLNAFANDSLSIDVKQNQPSFQVTLKANPTTGYKWSVVNYDKKLLTLSSSVYQAPKTMLIGAGGKMVFTFTLNKGQVYPAQTKMTFNYARPWEKGSGDVQSVVVNFVK